MPQHDNSIRSALCTDNDPSLIGRAERIPCYCGLAGCRYIAFVPVSCAAALKQPAQSKGGSKGGICFVHSLSGRGAPPAHTNGTSHKTRQNRITEKRW